MILHTDKPPRRRRLIAAVGAFLFVGSTAGLFWFQPWRLWTNTVVNDALPAFAASDSALPLVSGQQLVRSGAQATIPVVTAKSAATEPGSGAATERAGISAAGRPALAATSSTSRTAPSTSRSAPTTETVPVIPTAAVGRTLPTGRTAPTPAAPVATVLAGGELITHEHKTSGTVRIVRLADGRRVLTLENLSTSDGPALHVWLTDAPVIDGEDGWKVFDDGRYTDLGALKGNRGNQVYPLPADLDLSQYSSVSIWCERFSVSFGAAEVR